MSDLNDKPEFAKILGDAIVTEINRHALQQLVHNPAMPLLSLDLVNVEGLVQFIESRHAGTFGDFFVQTPRDRIKAAEWFVKTVREYYAFLHKDGPSELQGGVSKEDDLRFGWGG